MMVSIHLPLSIIILTVFLDEVTSDNQTVVELSPSFVEKYCTKSKSVHHHRSSGPSADIQLICQKVSRLEQRMSVELSQHLSQAAIPPVHPNPASFNSLAPFFGTPYSGFPAPLPGLSTNMGRYPPGQFGAGARTFWNHRQLSNAFYYLCLLHVVGIGLPWSNPCLYSLALRPPRPPLGAIAANFWTQVFPAAFANTLALAANPDANQMSPMYPSPGPPPDAPPDVDVPPAPGASSGAAFPPIGLNGPNRLYFSGNNQARPLTPGQLIGRISTTVNGLIQQLTGNLRPVYPTYIRR